MASADISQANSISALRKDLPASIVVFLVALPMCMGVAIASGMPPAAGIITGIIGGIIVGVIAGSPLQISGPAAGLCVLVLQLVQTHGPAMLGVIVLFAGLLQIAAGYLRLGQWFRAVSPAVIHGMLAGIGVLIFVSQFHVMLDGKPFGTGIQNLLGVPGAVADAIRAGDSRLSAGEIGALTISTIFFWSTFAPKKLQFIPALLVGVITGMAAAAIFKLETIKHVAVPDNIWSVVNFPAVENVLRISEPAILIAAFSIALIASAETLLSATAVDQMHRGVRTKYDQELRAQGVGNALCGLLGVLPMSGVVARSGANVEAGAVSRNATVLHGVWLLLVASVIPFTLHYIPVSSLAAVLVYTGYKLAYPKIVKELIKFGPSEVLIYAATVATIVVTDLLTGVLVGLALSLAKLLYAFSHLQIDKTENTSDGSVSLHLKGSATLIRLPTLASELEQIKPGSHVRVFIDELDYIDHACIDLLTNWDRQHKSLGGSLDIEWEGLTKRYQSKAAPLPKPT